MEKRVWKDTEKEEMEEDYEIANKQRLLKISEISLWLDTYDDIFSDFDSRPYLERALSDDFLHEAKNASRDKPSGKIELRFILPKNKRNVHYETLIKKRLKNHFKKHFNLLKKETKEVIKGGILFILLGILSMFIASIILVKGNTSNLFINFIIILLEPAGWFLFWEGLAKALFEPKTKEHDLNFYRKMINSEIIFSSY